MVNKTILKEMQEWESRIEPLVGRLLTMAEKDIIDCVDIKKTFNAGVYFSSLSVRIFCQKWESYSGLTNLAIYIHVEDPFDDKDREKELDTLTRAVKALEAGNYNSAFDIIYPNFFRTRKTTKSYGEHDII